MLRVAKKTFENKWMDLIFFLQEGQVELLYAQLLRLLSTQDHHQIYNLKV